MNSIYEKTGGAYRRCGDYLIPDLSIPEEEQQPIGKYGRMRMDYLEKHHPGRYEAMLLTGRLMPHLREIDETAHERLERIISQMKEQEGVTERLKAADQMEWVRRMNSIHHRAEETILVELIYT